jgi:hypothetical protein
MRHRSVGPLTTGRSPKAPDMARRIGRPARLDHVAGIWKYLQQRNIDEIRRGDARGFGLPPEKQAAISDHPNSTVSAAGAALAGMDRGDPCCDVAADCPPVPRRRRYSLAGRPYGAADLGLPRRFGAALQGVGRTQLTIALLEKTMCSSAIQLRGCRSNVCRCRARSALSPCLWRPTPAPRCCVAKGGVPIAAKVGSPTGLR